MPPIALVANEVEAGFVIEALMHVFDHVHGIIGMPLHIQKAIRLRGIARCFGDSAEAAEIL